MIYYCCIYVIIIFFYHSLHSAMLPYFTLMKTTFPHLPFSSLRFKGSTATDLFFIYFFFKIMFFVACAIYKGSSPVLHTMLLILSERQTFLSVNVLCRVRAIYKGLSTVLHTMLLILSERQTFLSVNVLCQVRASNGVISVIYIIYVSIYTFALGPTAQSGYKVC